MAELTLIYSGEIDAKWLNWIKEALASHDDLVFASANTVFQVDTIKTERLIIICDLNEIGRDEGVDQLVKQWKCQSLQGKVIGLICRSQNDWHTKTYARSMALILNALGATLIGKPLVELLPKFENFAAWKKSSEMDLEAIAKFRVEDLVFRVKEYEHQPITEPKVLVLHACSEKTSNTLALWRMVSKNFSIKCTGGQIREVYIERGSITDCIGCDYTICVNEARSLNCVVGGQFVHEIMPALEWADVIVWLCPNYNDTLSADLIAVINRMSGFYRTRDLSVKAVFAVIISGNSGTDAVANQLIGSLNLNKGYQLPPKFCLSEIANDPLSVLNKEGIEDKAKAFAMGMTAFICE